MAGMNVVDVLRRVRSGSSTEAGRIVALLSEDSARGLARVASFVQSPQVAGGAPAVRLERLERLLGAVRATLDPLVRALRGQPLPYAPDELSAFHRAALALEALRDGFRQAHADLAAPTAPTADGAPDAMPAHACQALARALHAQSLRLATAWRLRIAVERDHWDELCRLVFPLWQGAALDTAFPERPDAGSADPSGTARAAFTLPLLLRLLDPLGLSLAERRIAWTLASRWSAGVGLRIDVDGRLHLCTTGPALMLSVHHTVRLDTRAALAATDRLRERLAAGVPPERLGLRTALSAPAIVALLERVRAVWAPLHTPAPLVRAPLARALLHVGLPPAIVTGAQDGLVPRLTPAAAHETAPASVSPYDFGRRRTGAQAPPGGADAGPAHADPVEAVRAAMHAVAEPVAWRGRDVLRSVFTRGAQAPRLRLGQLVAVLPCRPDEPPGRASRARPGSGPSRLHVGRIVTLAQTGSVGSRQPFGHDVGIAFWPGSPLPVRVRLDDSAGFEDGWWLPSVPGTGPASLVLRRDRFERPQQARVHDAAGTGVLRLLGLLERGLDFDRIEVGPAA